MARWSASSHLQEQGEMASPSSYRAVWMTSILSKIFHKYMVAKLSPYIETMIRPTQFGGIRGRDTGFATTCVISFIDQMRALKAPSAILFLDLTCAFDHVLREIIVGLFDPAHTLEQVLLAAGVHESLAKQFHNLFADSPLLAHIRADPSLIAMVRSMHWGIHFRVEGTNGVTVTGTGSRAGDSFGTVFSTWSCRQHVRLSRR